MTGGSAVVTSPEALAFFERLLALDPPTHEHELDTLKRTRPDLYPQVMALVESDRKAGAQRFLEGSPRLPPEEAPSLVSAGQSIGVYRIERRIGEGGMGEVWLGARADGRYQGQVAIKTLHPHLARPGLRERFLREGQILASLAHPNIARLLDAGAAEPGLLYLVLEFIEGERIDRWCDQGRRDVPERLRLFLQVCDAVSHAHTHLVVHRDLKPSNILVTREGAVKLLDFGIAKLLEAEDALAPVTDLTRLGGRALTPEYAAPEQIKGDPVTTATDVYSLGMVLFGLLSGSRPYGVPDSIPAQLEREVLETEPKRLSEAAPSERRKSLRGDLDNIVAKALKKNPAERYASVQALADDLRRHLNFEPVSARPDAFGYRARRFLRRHWVGAGATAAVLLAIMVGAGTALWQAQEANAQRARAERISEFLLSVFREQDPFARPGAEGRTPAQLVALAAARLDDELADEPELRAQLQQSLAEIQLHLGEPAAGRALLERALAERRSRSGDNADSAAILGRLAWAWREEGDTAAAIRQAREALAILDRLGAGGSVAAARIQLQLVNYLDFGKPGNPEARALVEQVQHRLDAALGPDHPDSIAALHRRAQLLEQVREDAAAEPLLREAITRYERSAGADSARLTEPLITLAGVLMRTGRYPEAEAAYERAAGIARRHLGPRGMALSRALGRLANFYRETRRYDRAEPLFVQARAALPDSARSQLAELLMTHGQLLIEMNRAPEAEPLLRQAYELRRADLGDDNGFTWFFAAVWGESLSALGRYDQAERVQREALRQIERVMGSDAYQVSLVAERLAQTLHQRGHYAEAAAQRRRVLTLSLAKYPGAHPITADRRRALAQELAALKTPTSQAEAVGLLDQAIAAFRALPPPSPRVADALLERGELRLARGDKSGARDDLREALEQMQDHPGAAPAVIEAAKALLKRASG